MPTWTGKTRETSTFTPKPKANQPVAEAYLKIDEDNFLNIGGGNKLVIQPSSSGQSWTPKPRAT